MRRIEGNGFCAVAGEDELNRGIWEKLMSSAYYIVFKLGTGANRRGFAILYWSKK